MIEEERLISPAAGSNDQSLDRSIRPLSLQNYIGQSEVKKQMEIFIGAARNRGEAMDHTLIFGPPGLGKTTLANIIANELNVAIKSTSGPVLEKAGDLAAMREIATAARPLDSAGQRRFAAGEARRRIPQPVDRGALAARLDALLEPV